MVTKTLSPSLLDGYAREVQGGAGRLCLLEHQFEVPEAFARRVFGLTENQPIPLLESLHGMRPLLCHLAPLSRWRPRAAVAALPRQLSDWKQRSWAR